jgi:glycosyltransferase involved in cell wall biosynthesis
MAKNLKLFSDAVAKKTNVININISPGQINRSHIYHLTKVKNVILGAMHLLKLAVAKKVTVVYMPPDAGFGAYYSLIFVMITRLFAIPLFLHHRSFAYINKSTLGMSLINKCESKDTTHIFLCEKMETGFERNYGIKNSTLIVSNAQHVTPADKVNSGNEELVIGYLSNLSFEKGLKQVFQVCNLLEQSKIKFRLDLGGPTENAEVKEFLNLKLIEFKDKVNYYGPIKHNNIEQFYANLDLFLFPTEYRNEAQPNVLFEANAAGVPVLSINTGCISTDVNCENGFVFDSQSSFAEESLEVIKILSADKIKLRELKQSTLDKIRYESKKAKSAYENLVDKMVKE